jgi:oligoendopeptidase F
VEDGHSEILPQAGGGARTGQVPRRPGENISRVTDTLPRWDLTPFFASIGDRAVSNAVEELGADVARLVALYDEHDVRGGEPAAVDADVVASFEAVVEATDAVREKQRTIFAFVKAHVDTDASDATAAALLSELQAGGSPLRSLGTRFDAWIARFGAKALVAGSPVAAEVAWPLEQAERASTLQMSEAEEELASELWLTGAAAWGRLHGDISSQVVARVEHPDGHVEETPITVVRGMSGNPDPALREAAYCAEIAAWKTVEVPLAAAMNGVKGEACVLNRRRGWPDALEPVLHANSVDRDTLAALQRAVVTSLPEFRRYLRAKARNLGYSGGLRWWDLFAPVGDPSAAAVSWDEACATVRTAFSTYSPALRSLADRAFAESWIDAEAHGGKRDGAYCMGFAPGVSRVFMNFAGNADSVSTLAHELGHAYHNVALGGRSPMQRATPMALAETASIFCETVLVESLLDGADDARRLVVLDTDLMGTNQVVVDIHSRFLFESALFERRARRPLSPAELCELMVEAQTEAYGDGMDLSTLHPYMWAVKPHYYGTHFYNWPYTYGLLFGLGLYARFQEDPDRFRGGYDDLLSSTGLGSAADLAARFGIDVRDEAFWASSLAVCAARIDTYEGLTPPA